MWSIQILQWTLLAVHVNFFMKNEHLLVTLSQRKISAILNITPETLSRNISILKKEKIVTVEKRTIMISILVWLRELRFLATSTLDSVMIQTVQ